jgi:hypothetical protein
MTAPQKPLPHVQPFLPPPARPPRKNFVDMRGMLSILTMLVSLAALSLSMFGAAKFVFDVFYGDPDKKLEGLPVKLVVLGFTFFFGWVVGQISIRSFGNLVYPIIVQIYAWGCLFAVSFLYLKVIQKLFIQEYSPQQFWAYLFMLLGGLFVLLCLHLMTCDPLPSLCLSLVSFSCLRSSFGMSLFQTQMGGGCLEIYRSSALWFHSLR